MYKIYTDGSCIGNPGRGGWGAVIVYPDGTRKELSGSLNTETTNNRMEIIAVIKAISSITAPHDDIDHPQEVVEVYCDSTLVINTMNGIWKQNKNADLWDQLEQVVAKHNVSWFWIKGHAGHKEQERADKLAKKAAKK